MKVISIVRSPYTRLLTNVIYALFNCILGVLIGSWWFITVGAYYLVLGLNRFFILKIKRSAKDSFNKELIAKRMTGILLVILSLCITGINVLTITEKRGTVFHEIIMISIAAYTFTKVTFAIIGMVKARHSPSPVIKALRNIVLAEAFVSIYSMQRSMLVTFPGLSMNEILIFNVLTGTAVWIIVLLLGINLIGGKTVDMAKSKIVETNEKIAETVTSGYKKIEKGVVDGYKKIEKGVVDGYTKIEDKFIDAYLTKDGETVEEAKARLKNKNK